MSKKTNIQKNKNNFVNLLKNTKIELTQDEIDFGNNFGEMIDSHNREIIKTEMDKTNKDIVNLTLGFLKGQELLSEK